MTSLANLHVALLHWPMANKLGELIATATTSIDLHDLGRTCTTYDVPKLWVVQPLDSQRAMVERILAHWTEGPGSQIHPDRPQALRRVELVRDLDELAAKLPGTTWVATSAAAEEPTMSVSELRRQLHGSPEAPYVLCFGTGWGMAPQVLAAADAVLEPIRAGSYNHLSVRSAVAIYLDRLWRGA